MVGPEKFNTFILFSNNQIRTMLSHSDMAMSSHIITLYTYTLKTDFILSILIWYKVDWID